MKLGRSLDLGEKALLEFFGGAMLKVSVVRFFVSSRGGCSSLRKRLDQCAQ